MKYRMRAAFAATVLCHFFNALALHAHTEAQYRAEVVRELSGLFLPRFIEEQFNHKDVCRAYVLPPQEHLPRWSDLRLRLLDVDSLAEGEWFFWSHAQVISEQSGRDRDLPYYVVAILRIETNFGQNFGTEPALRTFYEVYKRNRHARPATARNILLKQLAPLLAYARDNNTDPCGLLGSRAGAIGLPQFMPASLSLARDGDGDGKIDLFTSVPDASASIVNFLRAHGWSRRSRIKVLRNYCGGKYAWIVDEYARKLKDRVEKGHK